MKENVILDKSKAFALRIIRLYQFLCETKKEYVLSKQVLRSGTSIGAMQKKPLMRKARQIFTQRCTLLTKKQTRRNIGLNCWLKAATSKKRRLTASMQIAKN